MEQNIDLSHADKDGMTALHCACARSARGCVRLLLGVLNDEKRSHALRVDEAWVDARDKQGRTALHHAAVRGDPSIVEMLVAAGADPASTSKANKTPADLAGSSGAFAALAEATRAVDRRERFEGAALRSHVAPSCEVAPFADQGLGVERPRVGTALASNFYGGTMLVDPLADEARGFAAAYGVEHEGKDEADNFEGSTMLVSPAAAVDRGFEAAYGVDVLFSIILLKYTKKDAVRVRRALERSSDCFRNFRIAITCNGYEDGLVRPEVFPFRDLRRAFPVQERLRQDLCGNQISGAPRTASARWR